MNRVIILGLDGATFDLIKPFVSQGELPNIKKLMEEGTSGNLKSVVPPMSPPAWTSFMTGKNQGKHGIYDFTEKVPNTYSVRFINSSKRDAKTIWKMLSDAGKRVMVTGVPFTYPPEHINGGMISGFDAPGTGGGVADNSTMYPPELYNELIENVGKYYITSNVEGINNDEARLKEVHKTLQRKIETAAYLLNKEKWDCFMFVIGETDAVAHYFWKYYDPSSPLAEPDKNTDLKLAILSAYRKADEFVGTLLKYMDDETILFVMSDHGQGGYSNKAVYPNIWLEKEGYLKFAKMGAVKSTYQVTNRAVLNKFKQIGVKLPPYVKNIILRKTVISNHFESTLRFSGINWEETVAYAEETPYYPMIWINLKGRDPGGIVSDKEYEKIRDNIIQRLYGWKDPETNLNVINHVYKREEVYNGAYLDKSPDLIIDWNLDKGGYAYLSRSSLDTITNSPISKISKREARAIKSGSHRDYGIFISYGKNINRNNILNKAKLIDLAPTILYYMGMPIPKDMDGVVLKEIFREEFLATTTVKKSGDSIIDTKRNIQDYSEEDAVTIQKRLADLGYL